MIHWLSHGSNWEVLAAIVFVLGATFDIIRRLRRRLRAAWAALKDDLREFIEDTTTSRVGAPIVRELARMGRIMEHQHDECREDRAVLHAVDARHARELAYLRDRVDPATPAAIVVKEPT